MVSRAVVVGSGSAGRRHAVALTALDDPVDLVIVRRAGCPRSAEGVAPLSPDVFVADLDEALEQPVDIGVVAGPATLHTAVARRLLDAGAVVLVEKPVAAEVDDALQLLRVEGAAQQILVGYHLRFGDTAPELRRLVRAGSIGTPETFRFDVGQHLDQWRPGTDPRDSVSARRELGGGVLRELSHEFDALRFVLDTEIEHVLDARLRHDGAPTDGAVETVADLRLAVGAAVGSVHLDMTSQTPHRRWQIRGTDGVLTADLLTSTITLAPRGAPAVTVAEFSPGERDRCEARLVAHLMAMTRDGVSPRCTVADGVAALMVVDAAERSAASGHAVQVRPRSAA